jgi:hypothetical protein
MDSLNIFILDVGKGTLMHSDRSKVQTERAEIIHQQLARCGILTRYFAAPRSLRFGLPGCEGGWLRLAAALDQETVCTQ